MPETAARTSLTPPSTASECRLAGPAWWWGMRKILETAGRRVVARAVSRTTCGTISALTIALGPCFLASAALAADFQEASEVSVCGNGILEAGETCDDGDTVTETCNYGETSCTVCDASCQTAPGATSFCGDFVVDSANGETCDDGNTEPGDGCDASCQIEGTPIPSLPLLGTALLGIALLATAHLLRPRRGESRAKPNHAN